MLMVTVPALVVLVVRHAANEKSTSVLLKIAVCAGLVPSVPVPRSAQSDRTATTYDPADAVMALDGRPDAELAVPAFAVVGTDPDESVNITTCASTFDPAPMFGYATATVIAAGDAPVDVVQIEADVPCSAVPPVGTVDAALPVHAAAATFVHVSPVEVTDETIVLEVADAWFVVIRQASSAFAGGVNDAEVAVAEPAEDQKVLVVGALSVT